MAMLASECTVVHATISPLIAIATPSCLAAWLRSSKSPEFMSLTRNYGRDGTIRHVTIREACGLLAGHHAVFTWYHVDAILFFATVFARDFDHWHARRALASILPTDMAQCPQAHKLSRHDYAVSAKISLFTAAQLMHSPRTSRRQPLMPMGAAALASCADSVFLAYEHSTSRSTS